MSDPADPASRGSELAVGFTCRQSVLCPNLEPGCASERATAPSSASHTTEPDCPTNPRWTRTPRPEPGRARCPSPTSVQIWTQVFICTDQCQQRLVMPAFPAHDRDQPLTGAAAEKAGPQRRGQFAFCRLTAGDLNAAGELADMHRAIAARLPADSELRGLALRVGGHWARLGGMRGRHLSAVPNSATARPTAHPPMARTTGAPGDRESVVSNCPPSASAPGS